MQTSGPLATDAVLSNAHPEPQKCVQRSIGRRRVGIGYSDDKLLQTRIFSYADTQRHRLGPNYLMLPANAPKCAHHNNHHDGFMNFMHRDEEVRSSPKLTPGRTVWTSVLLSCSSVWVSTALDICFGLPCCFSNGFADTPVFCLLVWCDMPPQQGS